MGLKRAAAPIQACELIRFDRGNISADDEGDAAETGYVSPKLLLSFATMTDPRFVIDSVMARSRTAADVEATSRRGRPRSAETTAAILESAYALMAGAGLAAASIDAIARHCNVSKMTIYKWWPSRDALLVDAFLNQAALTLPLAGPGGPLVRLLEPKPQNPMPARRSIRRETTPGFPG